MFKLPAWSEKSNLFIAVRLQVGRVFDQTVVEAAVVALVEALATGFVHKRHEVHLKHSRGGKLIYSVQTSCTARYLWSWIHVCTAAGLHAHLFNLFIHLWQSLHVFSHRVGLFMVFFYHFLLNQRVLLSNQCLHWFSTEYGWMMFSFWNIWVDYRDKIRQYY